MASSVADMLRNVLIVDSYPIVRIGIATLFDGLAPGGAVLECAHIDEAISAKDFHAAPFDLAVFGMHGYDFPSLDGLIGILQSGFAKKVLVIAEPGQPFLVARCVAAGFHAVIGSFRPIAYLADVIHRMADGQRCIDFGLMSPSTFQKLKMQEQAFSLFSRREREIAKYLRRGVALHVISGELNIAYTTVATYRNRILKKAKVSSTAEFIRLSVDIEDILDSKRPLKTF